MWAPSGWADRSIESTGSGTSVSIGGPWTASQSSSGSCSTMTYALTSDDTDNNLSLPSAGGYISANCNNAPYTITNVVITITVGSMLQ